MRTAEPDRRTGFEKFIGGCIVGAIVIGTGLLFWILIEAALFVRHSKEAADLLAQNQSMLNAAMRGTHKNGDDGYLVLVQRLLQNSNSAANAVKQTAQDTNRIAKSQEEPSKKLTASSIALLDAGKDSVVTLGKSIDGVNGIVTAVKSETLPKLNASVDSLNGLIGDFRPAAVALAGVMTESANVARSLNLTVTHADALLADPAWSSVAGNLNIMSASLSGAAGHINGAAGNVQLATAYIRDDLAPTHLPLWQRIIQTAVPYGLGALVRILVPTTVNVGNSPTVKVDGGQK